MWKTHKNKESLGFRHGQQLPKPRHKRTQTCQKTTFAAKKEIFLQKSLIVELKNV